MGEKVTCDNCSHEIGKLETAHLWQDHVVCDSCRGKLRKGVQNQSGRQLPVLILSVVAVCGLVLGVAASALFYQNQGNVQLPAKPAPQQVQAKPSAPVATSNGRAGEVELVKARARIVELETQVAAMQKQVALAAITKPTVATATISAKPNSPAVSLTVLLENLPETLRPNLNGETQRTAQQRNDWLKQNIVGQTVTVVIMAYNAPAATGKPFVGGKLQNPPAWAAEYPLATGIFCDFDSADAALAHQEGAGPGTDGKVFRGDIVTIRGEIEGPEAFGAQVSGLIRSGISLGHCQVLSVQAAKIPLTPLEVARATTQAATRMSTTQAALDSNTTVANAIQVFSATLVVIQGSSDTDIQKRQKWLAAVKDLELVLAKKPITISYTISNVRFIPTIGAAQIDVSRAVIKSSAPQVPDVVFSGLYGITAVCSETIAATISTKSTMTLDGFIRIGVLDKPAAQQPAYVNVSGLAGFMPIGDVHDQAVQFPSLWNGIGSPPFLIQSDGVLRVDGVARTVSKRPSQPSPEAIQSPPMPTNNF